MFAAATTLATARTLSLLIMLVAVVVRVPMVVPMIVPMIVTVRMLVVMVMRTTTAPTLVVMVMIVVVMVMPATTASALMRVLMAVRVHEDRRQPPLQRNRLLARRIACFDRQRHHLSGNADVIHLAEVVPAQTPLPVENQKRRRTLELIGVHRLWQRATVLLVDGHREIEVMFIEEGFELGGRLLVSLLKNRMQTDHLDFIFLELCVKPCKLRQQMPSRTWAVHLECSEHHHLTLGCGQRRR